MRKIYIHIMTYKLLYIGLLIHLLFYISVAWTHWLDIFFSPASLHIGDRGIDFLQVPRGAWAAWHGGSLSGAPMHGKVYAPAPYYINTNVYHPLFTLMLGSLFMQFTPTTAYYGWIWAKLAISLAGVMYFYWSFRDYKHVQFACFVLLTSFSAYAEVAAGQFHLLFNVSLLLFVISLVKNTSRYGSGLLYWLCLLVKPIGLLFVPVLLLKRRWIPALAGIALFALVTWLFAKDPYYINNLVQNILHPDYTSGQNQVITLSALLHSFTHWPAIVYSLIQYSVFGLLLALITVRRLHISTAIFLMIVYFLLFYNLVYEYDWSTLAYVLAPCIVLCPAFQTRMSKICILLTCLPSCFIVLRLLHIDIDAHNNPGTLAWQLMVISKLVPLVLLCESVLLWPDVAKKPLPVIEAYTHEDVLV